MCGRTDMTPYYAFILGTLCREFTKLLSSTTRLYLRIWCLSRLQAGRPGFNSRQMQWWDFSLHHRVQTGSGFHPASYSKATGSSSPDIKRPGCEGEHLPPCSAKIKNAWSYTSTPQYLHGVVLN